MASVKRLNDILTNASKSLDKAATLIQALDIHPKQNIRKIADLLVVIFEIQEQIHERRPDLIPPFLHDTDYARKMAAKAALKSKMKSRKRR